MFSPEGGGVQPNVLEHHPNVIAILLSTVLQQYKGHRFNVGQREVATCESLWMPLISAALMI